MDVRDVASAMIAALERGNAGERYLLNAVNLSVPDLLGRLERISGVAAPRMRLPRSRGLSVGATRLFGKAITAIGGELPMSVESVEMAQYYWYCDSGKAMRELGFSPRDLTDTLRDTISDLLSRGIAHPRAFGHREGKELAARGLARLLGQSGAE